MVKKYITVEYYSVAVKRSPGLPTIPFETLLSAVDKLPNGEPRNFVFQSSSPVRLEEYDEDEEFCSGNIVRIRMDGFPQKINIHRGGMEGLGLNEDDGLGEETAFLFHKPTQTLLLQYNRFGVTATQFETYFPAVLNKRALVNLTTIITNEAYQSFEKKHFRSKKLEIAVAPLRNSTLFEDSGDSTAKAIKRQAELLGAPQLNLIVSVGHEHKRGLNRENLSHFINTLLSIRSADQDSVSVLRILGANDIDEDLHSKRNVLIDFITDRLFDRQECILTERVFAYNNRKEALYNSWMANEEHILRTRAQVLV